jgi:hypothetical protein
MPVLQCLGKSARRLGDDLEATDHGENGACVVSKCSRRSIQELRPRNLGPS